MPVTIPPFAQFQAPTFPLRGLWNVPPQEGDKFVNAEIDWGSYTVDAIQFSLSGNSPVPISQIVSLYIDNRRCGVDVDFLFPDSGFLLTVPAHTQGLYPVLTNALMFYVIATDAQASDTTIMQVLNSLPPPIGVLTTAQQNAAGVSNINASASGSTVIVPPGVFGTLNTISLSFDLGGAGGSIQAVLADGDGRVVWQNVYAVDGSGAVNVPVDLTGIAWRFHNGLVLSTVVTGTVTGTVSVNVYYTTP